MGQKINDVAFSDMLTTQDTTWATAERKIDKTETKNHYNASESNASKNYGKKKTTKVLK